MVVNLQGVAPQGGTVSIPIEITAPVNISAFVARQKVNRFVVMEVSTQLLAETPELRVGERLCWSVPVMLTSPARGIIGKVGEIAVDVTTGELLVDQETVQRMSEDARRLAEPSPLP
jgi:hypothetical protein